MADEEIGGVSIGIKADFSDLDAQFEAAVARAVAEGQTLAEAIQAAMKAPDASAVTGAFDQLGAAAQQAAASLQPVADEAQAAAKGVAEFGSAADLAARPIGSTAVASTELGAAAQTAATGANDASTSWSSFGSTLLGLAGLSLTVGALKELVIGSIEVADKIGDTEQSLTRLTGSASQAADMMKRLRSLADDDGLSFPGLLTAVTRLQTLLPMGADVVGVMGELANVSETLTISIEAAGQKFSAIVDSGNASEKALNKLGLTMGDITRAMEELGISADKAFKDLSTGERFDVMTAALKKFDGAAKELNDDIGGDWTRAMNAAKDAMKNLGDAIGDGEHKFSVFSTTVKVVEGVTLSLLAGLKVLIDGVVGSSTVVVEAIKGMATAWADLAKGIIDASAGNFKGAFDNFKNAAKDASTAFDSIKAASIFTIDSIKKDWTDGTNALDKAFSTTKTGAQDAATGVAHLGDTFDGAGGKAGTAADKVTVLAKATHDFVDMAKAAAAGMLDFQTATERAWDKVGLLVASQERVNEQLAVAKARFDAGQISAAEYSKAVDLAKKVNDELAKSLDTVNKIGKELVEGVWGKEIKAGIDAASDALKGFVTEAVKAPQPMSDLNRAMIDFGIGAGKAKTAVQDLHTPVETLVNDLTHLVEKAQASGDWTPIIQALDEFDKRIATLSKTDLPEAARQMDVFVQGLINANVPTELVQGQLDKLQSIVQKMSKEGLPEAANAWKAYLALLNQVPQTIGDILKAQQDEAQAEVVAAEKRGEGAEQWILKLKAVQIQQQLLKDQADGLGRVYTGLIDDVIKGFDNVAKGIADNIVDWKDWGSTIEGLLKSVAKSILETLIAGALMPLKDALLTLIGKLLPDVKLGLDASASAAKGLADAASQAAKSAENMSAAADKVSAAMGSGGGAGGAGSSGLAGSLSHLTSIIDVIADVISAGAAVASTIILSHISSDTGHIEVNTRGQLAEALNLRADLWTQHGEIYDRLGECKNALDGILDTLKAMPTTGPGGLPDAALANLAQLPAILGSLGVVNASVIAVLAGTNMLVLGLQNINSTLFTIHDDLGVAIGKLDTIITSLIYGNNTGQQASREIVQSMSTMSQQSTMAAHGIIGAIGAGVEENARGADAQIVAAEAARQAAARAYASATSLQGQLAALQAQVAADNQLAAALERSGNATLAQTYRNEAALLQQDVRALIPQLGTIVSSTMNVANMVGQADLNSGAYISNSTTQIVGAVYGAASVVAAAVGSAIAATGGYVSTPGTTTRVAPKGTQTNVPTQESQNPGNSNSPTGNTGQTGGVPPNGGGGYVTPIRQQDYSNAASNPYGDYQTTNTTVPFNPLNPFTWSSNMSQAQKDAINNAHVPSYDQGGMVPQDMLSLVHKDEMVLPPDLSQMLKRMASTPSTPGSYPTYAGSPGVSAGGGENKIYLPVTFNGVTNSRELLNLWTQEVKRIIPRATVFSS